MFFLQKTFFLITRQALSLLLINPLRADRGCAILNRASMAFSDPEQNIRQFGLSSHMVVADFGVGSGFYALLAGAAVGDSGKVYAIDLQRDLLSRVASLARDQGISSLEVIAGDLNHERSSGLKDGSVDAAIVANVLFQIENRDVFAREVARVLRKGGRALVIDWSESFGGIGPHPSHVVPKEEALSLFLNAGLSFGKAIVAGDHHYGFIMRKQ